MTYIFRIDAVALKKHDQFGFLPPGRPKQWRKKAFEVLREATADRSVSSESLIVIV